MSHQNMRGGFSGRSPRPDGHYSHRNRQGPMKSKSQISSSI
ncbi:hypothetical protein CUMW_239170, partial [Citrus unshiu]